MASEEQLQQIIEMLLEIRGDPTTPKNVKGKIEVVVSILKDGEDSSIRINKALDELDEIVGDNNLQQFTRTQIWNIVSLLEKI